MTRTTLPPATFGPSDLAPVASLAVHDRPVIVPLSDGGRLLIRLEYDADPDPAEDLGRLECIGRNDSRAPRPKGMDGAAVKLWSRSNQYWFQPDPDFTDKDFAIRRMREYLAEDWGYVGVVVTRESAPVAGPFGGTVVETESESLWGIESDAGSYFADVAADLAHELHVTANGEG